MEVDPLISIVTPVYNASDFIEQTVNSVLFQTYPHWELILIDDASTDGSDRICAEISKTDPRIHFEAQLINKGAAFCRNRATELATGEFIAFLDSDDFWTPDKLEIQVDFMQRTDCDVSFSNYLHVDEEGNPLNRRVVALPVLSYQKQLRNNYIGNLTGMYRNGRIGKVFSPRLRKRQDWGLWLEAIKRSGKPALGIKRDLAFYRLRKDSMSTNKFRLVKYNFLFYRDYLGQSFPNALFSLGRFFIEHFFVRPRYIEKID